VTPAWPTVGQAARALGISPQRIRDLINDGRLKAVRGPLNMRLIDPASLDELRRARERAERRRAEA